MMEKRAIFGISVLMNILGAHCFVTKLKSDHGQEPYCRSQFDYEYKVVQKIVALESLCENLKATNSQLREELSEMRLEIKVATNELRAEVQAATDELKVVQTKTNKLEDLKTTSAEGPKIAFLATMEATASVSAGNTIVFDTARTNVGGGYNVDDGIFTTPYDGIYQLSASMMTDRDGEIWAYFELNGNRIAYIYAHASDQRHDQGANTVILQLKTGDTVRVVSSYTVTVYGHGYTAFSGTLL